MNFLLVIRLKKRQKYFSRVKSLSRRRKEALSFNCNRLVCCPNVVEQMTTRFERSAEHASSFLEPRKHPLQVLTRWFNRIRNDSVLKKLKKKRKEEACFISKYKHLKAELISLSLSRKLHNRTLYLPTLSFGCFDKPFSKTANPWIDFFFYFGLERKKIYNGTIEYHESTGAARPFRPTSSSFPFSRGRGKKNQRDTLMSFSRDVPGSETIDKSRELERGKVLCFGRKKKNKNKRISRTVRGWSSSFKFK